MSNLSPLQSSSLHQPLSQPGKPTINRCHHRPRTHDSELFFNSKPNT
jgi:hypothetical protein